MIQSQSTLFGKSTRSVSHEATSANHRLLTQAGFIDQLMAGVYTYLPLGVRVLTRIQTIIRERLNAAGGQELLMPALHPKELWETTGRWAQYGADKVMYQFVDHYGHHVGLGPTHEEVVTPLVQQHISSYRDLPLALYQFQTKFRNEVRPKSGLLRGREFLMKDLYSFHANADDLQRYYDSMKQVYEDIFLTCGLGDATVLTYASGGSFSKYSHEFQTLTPSGEDTIFLCEQCRVAVNDEIINEQSVCPSCGKPRERLKKERAIEVGNIFQLQDRFSTPFKLTYRDPQGVEQPILMGCYGIGLGRVMGAVVEVHHDEHGIRWPESIAPFDAHVVLLDTERIDQSIVRAVTDIFAHGSRDLLVDDRPQTRAGEKFADADLIGIPYRIVISAKTESANRIEIKTRGAQTPSYVSIEKLRDLFTHTHVR